MDFADKKVIVIGAGISGNAAAVLAKKLGASEVILSDLNEKAGEKYDLSAVRAAGVTVVLGQQEECLLDGASYLIVSPAVPLRAPLVQSALVRGIEVLSEIEMAYRIAQSPLYAITGTNGKTTTTTLVGALMKKLPQEVGVGGNIGVALSDEVYRIADRGCVVAEISSYQLEASSRFQPHIAAILNLTPDHITRHGSMEGYQAAKEKLFANQTSADFLILNYDDERVRAMKHRAKSKVVFFSRQIALREGAFLKDGWLVIGWENEVYPLCPADSMQIKGGHNIENALAAALMAYLAGVSISSIAEGLQAFRGVAHRLEPVRKVNGVWYYNDSKATNTDSAIKALDTFAQGHIILLAGGTDKMTELTEFMQLVKQRTDALILFGAAAGRFKEAAQKNGVAHIYETGYSLEKAVQLAYSLAKPPQMVLLSPACASFDMFESYEQRGEVFKRLVNSL